MKQINASALLASLAALTLLTLPALAAPVAYTFRITDNSGTLVPGATVQVGLTTLTAGSATALPASAGEKILSTGAAPSGSPSVTLLDYGTGDYSLVYDPATQGELYLPLSVSKSGSAITGTSALIALTTPADSSSLLILSKRTLNRQTYNPSTKVLQLLNDDGTNFGPALTLSIDSNNNITAR